MNIDSIAVVLPSRRVTNAQLLQEYATANHHLEPDAVEKECRRLNHLLESAGADCRYYRDKENGETAMALVLEACQQAFLQSGAAASEIDLLIYCGVGRCFLEPPMAYFVARSLGLSCECFDVLDACMSWVRALHLAHTFLHSGQYSRVLIVNGEFNIHEHGYPELLKMVPSSAIEYTFPAFTIGEAATATILGKSEATWTFRFRSLPQHVGLCTLPISGFEEFGITEPKAGLNGQNRFTSFGSTLTGIALREMEAFIRTAYQDLDRIDIWFPHAASAHICRVAAERLHPRGRVYSDVFPKFGNLVSASIPTAMFTAEKEGLLKRGHQVVLCPVSAGMSLGLVDFVY